MDARAQCGCRRKRSMIAPGPASQPISRHSRARRPRVAAAQKHSGPRFFGLNRLVTDRPDGRRVAKTLPDAARRGAGRPRAADSTPHAMPDHGLEFRFESRIGRCKGTLGSSI
ncbi:protein of unknown function [Burkholderia multivorans]